MNRKEKYLKLLYIVLANTAILAVIFGCAQISSVVDQLTSEYPTNGSIWHYISPHFMILYGVSLCLQIQFFYKYNQKQ